MKKIIFVKECIHFEHEGNVVPFVINKGQEGFLIDEVLGHVKLLKPSIELTGIPQSAYAEDIGLAKKSF